MKFKIVMQNFRRRYREPVILFLIKLFARLPFSVALKIGHGFGKLLWIYHGEMRKVTEKNLATCFPLKTNHERTELAKQSLIETGKNITEIAGFWCRPQAEIMSLITKVTGEEHIHQAIENGRGVIILAPHLGAWEIMGLYLTNKLPMTSMYRPPDMKGLEGVIRNGRTRFGGALVPTDIKGVKALLSALKRNELVGMLPDQDPGKNGGNFAPLFNVAANTITLTSKLAQKTNADVIGSFAKRNKEGSGYELFFLPANKKINNKNMNTSLMALNEEVEKLIMMCPEQYQWSYKRFKTRPENETSFY